MAQTEYNLVSAQLEGSNCKPQVLLMSHQEGQV